MDKIAFYGSISTGDDEVMLWMLKEWVKKGNLDVKVRLGGTEIVYDEEGVYFYCHGATLDGKPIFLLEGNMAGTLKEASLLLERLLKLCKDQRISSSLEYVQVTESGEEVSDQFYLE